MLSLFQHCRTVADFMSFVSLLHVVVYLGNVLHVGKSAVLSVCIPWTELLSAGPQ